MKIKEAIEKLGGVKFVYDQNKLLNGLNILKKYCDYLTPVAEHDEIWIYPGFNGEGKTFEDMLGEISEKDFNALGEKNWRIDKENEGWYITV